MKKAFLYILSALFIGSGVSIISVDAASVSSEKVEQFEVVPFAQLTDYQILLTGSENGISTYSGVKNNIRLSLQADSKEITKIIIAFDYDKSSSVKSADIAEIINVSNKIFPGKISNAEAAAELLEEKLSDMNISRDDDTFNIEQLRVEAHINNGMINLRITK